MKRFARWAFPALFLMAAVFIIWFLHLFTQVGESMVFINWDDSVQLLSDGTEQPFLWEEYSNVPALSGTYRFTGTLLEQLSAVSRLFLQEIRR